MANVQDEYLNNTAPNVTTPDYSINYNDEKFTSLDTQKNSALSELEDTYGGMIQNTDKFYNDQIQASKDWADKQTQLQNEQTDFTIEKIEQQKEQAHKDYLKEQSGAYVDWQKQSNQYGVNAENQASSGMAGTGYSESSQVSMYNQYQNRVATAREAFSQATLNYNNAITEARLQNSAILAEIAAETYMKQLELALEGFQYKNSLVADMTDKKMQTEQIYWQRYQDVLAQINQENALAEQIRQHNNSILENRYQAQLDRDWKSTEAQKDRDFQAAEAQKSRDHQASENTKDREHQSSENAKYYSFDNSAEVSTSYYQGDLNSDAKTYGTFSNGYQPKGINGHGKVSKSGDTIVVQTEVMYGPDKGKKQKLEQNIWKAEDGTLWYWEGRDNKYIQIG